MVRRIRKIHHRSNAIALDFAAYARAFGAQGETVARTEDFAPAFQRALACGTAALIELRLDPEDLTPQRSLSAIRQAAATN